MGSPAIDLGASAVAPSTHGASVAATVGVPLLSSMTLWGFDELTECP